MTTELSIVEPQALAHSEALTVADAAVAECFPVRSSGRLEISRAELYAFNPQPGRSYESGPRTWRQEKAQIDYLVRKLNEAGFPIDNEFKIWIRFHVSILRALKRCEAEWFLITMLTDGTNHYEWGSGIPSLSQGAGEKMIVSTSDQVLAHLPAGRTLYLNE
jgi:hypothetical protein